MPDLCGIQLEHPVINASGTFDELATREPDEVPGVGFGPRCKLVECLCCLIHGAELLLTLRREVQDIRR